MAVAKKCITVKSVHRIQRALIECASHECLDAEAGLGDTAPLAFGFFPLIGRESLEITVEARVVAIRPVKLAIATDQPAGFRAHRTCGLIEK
jgi:hypothetical protein